MKDQKEIERLEEIIRDLYRKYGEVCAIADKALSALEVKGFGPTAHAIRQELNKIKP